MARALWRKAQEMAENPTLWKRIKHSKHLDQYRRTAALFKQGKVKAGMKKALSIGVGVGAKNAISLIPVPYVGDLATALYEKGYGKVKAHSHEKAAGKARTAKEKAKFLLKELSAENLDRYRWKVADAESTFQALWTYAVESERDTRSICSDYGKAMAKYYYMENRIKKLEADLGAMKEAIQITEQWLTQIKGLNAGRERTFIALSSDIVKVDEEKHLKCDKTICVHENKSRVSTKLGRVMGWASKATGMLVEVGGPDYTSSGTYETDAKTGKSVYFRPS